MMQKTVVKDEVAVDVSYKTVVEGITIQTSAPPEERPIQKLEAGYYIKQDRAQTGQASCELEKASDDAHRSMQMVMFSVNWREVRWLEK